MENIRFMCNLEEKPLIVRMNISDHIYNLKNRSIITQQDIIMPNTLITSLYLLPYDSAINKLEEYMYLAIGTYKNYHEPYLKEMLYDDIPIISLALVKIRESINNSLRMSIPDIDVTTLSTGGLLGEILVLVRDPNGLVKEMYKNFVGELFNYNYYKDKGLL